MDVALETVSEVVSYKDKKELTQILPETWCLKKRKSIVLFWAKEIEIHYRVLTKSAS